MRPFTAHQPFWPLIDAHARRAFAPADPFGKDQIMSTSFHNLSQKALSGYESKLKQAGYVVFEHDGDWYYNEIDAGDEFSDGPYGSRAEVLESACRNLRLLEPAHR
jgi:hypothetical protein